MSKMNEKGKDEKDEKKGEYIREAVKGIQEGSGKRRAWKEKENNQNKKSKKRKLKEKKGKIKEK